MAELRKDRIKEFREKIYKRFNYRCCFVPTLAPHWLEKNIIDEQDKTKRCPNREKLKIYRKDGNINNNTDNNIFLLCPYHYGVLYHELITLPKRKREKLRGIRKETKKPEVLTEEEIKQFFNATIRNVYHLMLFQMMYYLGTRVNEITNLRKKYIEIKGTSGIVTLTADITKRKVERTVNIPSNMVQPIKKFIAQYDKDDILFPLTKQRVWQLSKYYAKKAKINKNIHPHTFRHSYASNIYNKTGDLKLVQELLGHKNLSSTAIYTHISNEYKKKALDKVFGE